MSRPVLALVSAALVVAVGIPGGAVQGSARPMRTLSALANPGLAALPTAGAPNPDAIMRIGVALQHPDPAGEDALLAAQYNPKSPLFHLFLSPESFASRFGVDRGSFAQVRDWLAAGGMDVLYSAAARDYVIVSGRVRDVDHLLGVTLRRYRVGVRTFVANERAPSVPADLPISSIIGLDSRAEHVPASRPRRQDAIIDIGSRTPQDLWSVYELPSGTVGRGIKIGIIGVGATSGPITYLGQFEDQFKLRHVPVSVVHTPAHGDYSDTSVDGEMQLDVAAVAGMAPGLDREILYVSPTYADTDLMGSLAAWVSDVGGPPIMSMSFGECEQTPLNPVLKNPALAPLDGNEHPSATLPQSGLANSSHPAEDQILKQAVMEGRTLFASAGDAGAGCSAVYAGNTNGLLPQIDGLTEDPASSPYTVGVGGTVLYTDGNTPAQRVLEYAWTHSGGNASPFITAPKYQQGVANLNRPCLMDSSGSPSNTGMLCRGVPDVAALSGDIISNGYVAGSGTSLSAPLWAGMWARVMGAAPGGRNLGFANEAIYRLAKDPARYANAFYDITQGTNGNPALPGWDYVTGWGVPRVSGLIKELLGVTIANPGPGLGGGVVGSASNASCGLAFTDPPNDASNIQVMASDTSPATDVLNGYLRYDAAAQTLTYYITVKSLDETVPSTYTTMSWTGYFTTPDGTDHFMRALLDLTGATAFEYGVFIPNPTEVGLTGFSEYQGTTTGKLVKGSPGVIQIVVPSSLAPLGTKLTTLYALTTEGRTLPAAAPGYFRGISPVMDTAPDTAPSGLVATYIVAPCATQARATHVTHHTTTHVLAAHQTHPATLPGTGVGLGLEGLLFLAGAALLIQWRRTSAWPHQAKARLGTRPARP